ncbi:uncharacterized protein LOC103316035 [Nasonia vitripennis]|uniref:Uncharacterized protein n=1 Tax=Nasonia vitripennis TaxID=7425 RepID=A0A7M7J6A4_NASVI|nr:uncharacterized protein LOC103316035 [Nasonia vitripennis]
MASDASADLTYYAYVRFVEKTRLKDQTFIVDQSQIVQKFDANLNFKRTGKYHIKHSDGIIYKAQIIFLESTKDALEAKIAKKRASIIPDEQLRTESENETKMVKTTSCLPSNAEKQKKLEKYLSLVDTKLDDNSYPDNVLKTTEKVSKENYQASLTEDEKDKFSETKVVEAANFEEDETEVEENKSADTEVKDVVARSVQDEKNVDKKQTSCSKLDHDANEKVPESQKENEARLKKKPKTSKVKIISKYRHARN